MHVFNSQVINHALSFLKESVLCPLSTQLTSQQKRIAFIVTAIFAALTACFFAYSFCRRDEDLTKSQPSEDEIEPIKNSTPPLTPIFTDTHPITPKTKAMPKTISEITPIKKEPVQKQPSPLASPKKEEENDKIKGESKEQEKETDIKTRSSGSTDGSMNDFSNNDKDMSLDDSSEFINPHNMDEDFVELVNFDDSDNYDVMEDEVPIGKKSPVEEQVFKIDGKFVSLRTLKCLEKLTKELAPLGKVYGKAIDNGDCFWDAFAQKLSLILKRSVTGEELRKKVSEEVKKLDEGPDEKNWVKQYMAKDPMDTYEDYRDQVIYSCSEALEKGLRPVWGSERRDGIILCHLYQVNLKVFSVGCMSDDPSQMTNPENFYFGADDEYPTGQPYSQTVEIALYPGHFVPVHDIKASSV